MVQKDGVQALGNSSSLGGAAGIRGCIAALIFEPATRTIKLIESTSEHGILTVEGSRVIQKVSMRELSEARKFEVEISLSHDPSTGSLGVRVT